MNIQKLFNVFIVTINFKNIFNDFSVSTYNFINLIFNFLKKITKQSGGIIISLIITLFLHNFNNNKFLLSFVFISILYFVNFE
jgi:hypothetical protein